MKKEHLTPTPLQMLRRVADWPKHTPKEVEAAIIAHCKEHKPLKDEYRMAPKIVIKPCGECGRDYETIEYEILWPTPIGNCECGGVIVQDKLDDRKTYEYRCVLCGKKNSGSIAQDPTSIPMRREEENV
jgi:hypothetical protein